MNETPGSSVKIPGSVYKIKKLVGQLIDVDIVYYIKCPNCKNYQPSKSTDVECSHCFNALKTATCEYFVYFPIEEQLKKSVVKNFDEILAYQASTLGVEDYISDIHHGIQFKKVASEFPDKIVLSLAANTDGAQLHKSSNKKAIWPVQLCQQFLKPSIRYFQSNVLVAAIYFGTKKPNMKDLFFPLLKDLKK